MTVSTFYDYIVADTYFDLLNGLDEIGLTLERDAAIETHERARADSLPWLDAPTKNRREHA